MVGMPPIVDNGDSERNVAHYASLLGNNFGNWHPFDLQDYVPDAYFRYWTVQGGAVERRPLQRPYLHPNGTYPAGCPAFPDAVRKDNVLREIWPELYHPFVADAEDVCANETRRLNTIKSVDDCLEEKLEDAGGCKRGVLGTGVSIDVDAKICTITAEMSIYPYEGRDCSTYYECTNQIGCFAWRTNGNGYGGYYQQINPAFCQSASGGNYNLENNCLCKAVPLAFHSDIEFVLKARTNPSTKRVVALSALPGHHRGQMSYGPFAYGEVKLNAKGDGTFEIDGEIGAGVEANGCKQNPLWIQHAAAAFQAEVSGSVVVQKNAQNHVDVVGKLTVGGSAGLYEGRYSWWGAIGWCGCNWRSSYTTVKGCPHKLIEASVEGNLQLEFKNVDTSCTKTELTGEFKFKLYVLGRTIEVTSSGNTIIPEGDCFQLF